MIKSHIFPSKPSMMKKYSEELIKQYMIGRLIVHIKDSR